MHGETGGVRRLRPDRGPGHAQRREQLVRDHLIPGPAAQPGHQLTEQRVPDVGVVVLPARRQYGGKLEHRPDVGTGIQCRHVRQLSLRPGPTSVDDKRQHDRRRRLRGRGIVEPADDGFYWVTFIGSIRGISYEVL